MYNVYRNQPAAAYLSLYFFILFLSNFKHLNFSSHFSQKLCDLEIETWHTRGQWADVSCLPESGCCCLFIPLFFIFLSLQFSNINIFVTLFSGSVRPRRLKLGTHVDIGQMYCVYRIQAAAVYLSLYFFIFLSLQFSNI